MRSADVALSSLIYARLRATRTPRYALADALRLADTSLGNRLRGTTSWQTDELPVLVDLLGITPDEVFAALRTPKREG